MQKVIQEFTIGFYDSTGVFSIYAKQHDTGRMLKFHLQDLDEDYAELLNDDQITVTLREQLPNGKSIPDVPIDPSYIDKEELSISVPITKDMIQMAGVAICDLTFGSLVDESIISTVKFKLIIDDILPVPESGYEREWFDTWTELWVKLKALENCMEENETVREDNEVIRQSNEAERQAAEQVRESRVQEQVDEAHGYAVMSGSYMQIAGESADSASDSADLAHMWTNGKADGLSVPSATNNAMFYAGQAMGASGIFNGTTAQWDALPETEKAKISTVILSDDDINSFITYKSNGGSGMMTVGLKNVGIPYVVRQCTFVPPENKIDDNYTEDDGYRYRKVYGYIFDTWNTNAGGTGVDYAPDDLYESDGNIDLFAQWDEQDTGEVVDEQYYLTVNADEGVDTHTDSQWVDKGESVNVTAIPKAGYAITGGTGDTGAMNEPKTVNITSEATEYIISWNQALATYPYGGFIDNTNPSSSTASNYGKKQIRYTNTSGNIAVADPYQSGSIAIKIGTVVELQMYAGSSDSVPSSVRWYNGNYQEKYYGTLMSVSWTPTANATLTKQSETGSDSSDAMFSWSVKTT